MARDNSKSYCSTLCVVGGRERERKDRGEDVVVLRPLPRIPPSSSIFPPWNISLIRPRAAEAREGSNEGGGGREAVCVKSQVGKRRRISASLLRSRADARKRTVDQAAAEGKREKNRRAAEGQKSDLLFCKRQVGQWPEFGHIH